MTTPELQLQTAFLLSRDGRIVSTREPDPRPGPAFWLARSPETCVWAVREDVPQEVAEELDRLAGEEPPVADFRDAPRHADRYKSLVEGEVRSGPAFTFPETVAQPEGVHFIDDLRLLERNFRGWTADEIPGRQPMVAVIEDGRAVSVCFCARRSDIAAEAGLETAAAFRGRGLGSRVTAAWALAVRATGRIPLYSTEWTNDAPLSVTRKLGLVTYACDWSLSA